MPSPSNEASITLAVEALKNDKTLILKVSAKVYNVNLTTRSHQRAARRDLPTSSRKLTDLGKRYS